MHRNRSVGLVCRTLSIGFEQEFEPGGRVGRNDGTGSTAAQTAARESGERSRSAALNDPFVLSVAGLRGLPSPRTAAVLAAYAYQPDSDLEGPRGPAADTVER